MHEEAIRRILAEHSKLSVDLDSITNDTDLYDAGLTSLTTVNLMLAIEDLFDIEFEDSMLSRTTFQSINSLTQAIEEIQDD